tara:strand:+ start:125 stop:1066 length:942 start_codon:yes stop_codon:yes gene_type:complete
MRNTLLLLSWLFCILLTGSLNCLSADKDSKKIWTDPKKAAIEDPDFSLQGEYVAKGLGFQAAAVGNNKFYSSKFNGGLPGQGWDGSDPEVEIVNADDLKEIVKGMKKELRVSPSLGAEPPAGAVVLFDGKKNQKIKGQVKDGLLLAGAQTTEEYGDFTLHLEFRLPYKPNSALSSQDRGNSGIYLQNRYETQVLDSFGLVYDKKNIKVPLKSDPKQWCGCFYKFKTADTPMCFPPLSWQTYDIDFQAPKFENGKKVADATITVKHNGVIIHDKVRLPKGTGAGGGRKEVPKGPIIFQGHGNPVFYRNIWIIPR